MWESVELEITRACNYNCRHCIAEAGEKRHNEFSLNELESILKQLKEYSFKTIIVTGGEPTERKDWMEVVKKVKVHDFDVILNTNLSNLNHKTLEKLEVLGVEKIRSSIYGSDATTHDSMTRTKGSFRNLIEKIKLLKNYKPELSLSCVVNRENFEQLDLIAELADKNGVKNLSFVRVIPGGRASLEKNELCLSTKQYKKYVEVLVGLKKDKKTGSGYLKNFETFEFLLEPELKKSRICSACVTNIGIRSDLLVTPCLALVKYQIGNLRENSLQQILKSEKAKKFITMAENPSDSNCKICPHLDFCKGGCKAHAFYPTGNMTAKDPGCWI